MHWNILVYTKWLKSALKYTEQKWRKSCVANVIETPTLSDIKVFNQFLAVNGVTQIPSLHLELQIKNKNWNRSKRLAFRGSQNLDIVQFWNIYVTFIRIWWHVSDMLWLNYLTCPRAHLTITRVSWSLHMLSINLLWLPVMNTAFFVGSTSSLFSG